MDVIEKTISNLIERQFPSFYREEGPVFVEFVKQYYKWLETSQYVVNKKIPMSTLTINVGNTTIVGKGSSFETDFVAGDRIAVYNDVGNDYIVYQIDSIANNTVMTLKDNPYFSYVGVEYGTVKDQFNPLYHARHILEYKDVDETTEEFLVYFKEKYLKGIRFETQTNTRDLIKHALDIYRSKGTERAIDLLFRLVFGRGAEVYLPGQDVFKLSSGKWYTPRYIEVSLNDKNKLFAGKEVTGVTTGAKAYVESVIRRNVKGKLVDILFVSAIKGQFKTDEVITIVGNEELIREKIRIIGSLTSIDVNINGTGTGFAIGDIIDILSPKGEKGKARVANVSNISGLVDFKLVNGGYGYTKDAEVIVSSKVLYISDVKVNTAINNTNNYFQLFEELRQPKALINFNSANGVFANGDNIYTYWPNNAVKGYGIVISTTYNDSTTDGSLLVAVREGDLEETYFYASNGTANTIQATQNPLLGYVDQTSTANIMGVSANLTLYTDNTVGNFNRNDEVYQFKFVDSKVVETANAKVLTFSRTTGAKAVIDVANTHGIFDPNRPLYNRSSLSGSASADIYSQDIILGVYDIPISFIASNGNYVYSSVTGSNGYVTRIGSGSTASVGVSDDVIYEETVILNSDFIADYLTVSLDSADYGFKDTVTDKDTVIEDSLNYNPYTIGKLLLLIGINKGQNYDLAPFVTVYEKIARAQSEKDEILTLTGNYNFAPGELITQASTNARGIVKPTSTSSILRVERLRMLDVNNFEVTTGTSSQIVGTKSGVVGNVESVALDADSEYLGLNAIISTETVGGNGAVTSLEVVDSGFGYEDGEEITFKNLLGEGVGTVRLGKIGKAQGYYKEKGGFLSDQKKLFDGDYYQEYSYDILSSITLNKYEDMLKKILHMSGTKYFSSLVYSTTANAVTSYVGKGMNISIETPAIITTEDDYITFNAQTAVSSNFIALSPQPFVDGDPITYYLYVGNTEIEGLIDNATYYVIQSNSTGIKLAANSTSDTPITITAGLNETGHAFRYNIDADLLLTEKSQIISREI